MAIVLKAGQALHRDGLVTVHPAPNGVAMVREERAAYGVGGPEAAAEGHDLGEVRVSLPEG